MAKIYHSDTGVAKETIALLCRSAFPKQTKREFDALGVKYNVAFDTDGSLLKSLAVKRSPEVFFLYRNKVVSRYEADVSNRALTKTMQARFKEFMTLK